MGLRGGEAETESLRLEFEVLRLTVRSLAGRVSELENRLAGSPTPARSVTSASSFARSSVPIETGDHEGRAALARERGRFLRRAYEGSDRGPSGRDRLALASLVYVVLGDHRASKPLRQ
eukprot:s5181_g5.t1